MKKLEKPFQIRYRYLGRIWRTVENGPDAKTAADRFRRLHPHVEFVDCTKEK